MIDPSRLNWQQAAYIMKKPFLVSKLASLTQKPDSLLSSTLAFAYYLQDLENILKSYLPETFQSHCQVAAFNYGELVLRCDSASWSSKLRFLTNQLLAQLNRHDQFHGLTKITIKADARTSLLKKNKRLVTTKLMSIENKKLLLHTAERVADTQLAQAIKRLTTHATPADS